MTCNCKAELASILREHSQGLRGSVGMGSSTIRNHALAATCDYMEGLADRLCPQAEPVLDGWMAKCDVRRCAAGWHIVTAIDGHLWMLCEDGAWRYTPAEGEGEKTAMFDTESAARAALAAASEPGVSAKDSSAKTDSSPAPEVAFDAGDLLRRLWSMGPYTSSGALSAGLHELHKYADHVASSAESAGYARAKAEQTPRRWPEGREEIGNKTSVLAWSHSEWVGSYAPHLAEGTWWLPQPAAPAAAKEGR